MSAYAIAAATNAEALGCAAGATSDPVKPLIFVHCEEEPHQRGGQNMSRRGGRDELCIDVMGGKGVADGPVKMGAALENASEDGHPASLTSEEDGTGSCEENAQSDKVSKDCVRRTDEPAYRAYLSACTWAGPSLLSLFLCTLSHSPPRSHRYRAAVPHRQVVTSRVLRASSSIPPPSLATCVRGAHRSSCANCR